MKEYYVYLCANVIILEKNNKKKIQLNYHQIPLSCQSGFFLSLNESTKQGRCQCFTCSHYKLYKHRFLLFKFADAVSKNVSPIE